MVSEIQEPLRDLISALHDLEKWRLNTPTVQLWRYLREHLDTCRILAERLEASLQEGEGK